MRIRWTPPAVRDMRGISDYLEEHHPRYRQATMRKLYEKIRGLKEAPYIGRPGRIEGTREILFSPLPYVVVYRVHNQAIEVWRIWHTSQSRSN
jgi:addiction module RelE/StbE family toxin